MSSLALMRWLESAPERYDRGMQWLTFGRADEIREAIAGEAVKAGTRVVEIGCGTGALSAKLLANGCEVTAVDQNPAMLEQARSALASASAGKIRWIEASAAEIDSLGDGVFDAVATAFCLSEMSPGERAYVLRAAARCLRPGGRLLIADEVVPDQRVQKLVHALLRGPQVLLGWLLTGAVSTPLAGLAAEIEAAGFRIVGNRGWLAGRFRLFIAESKGEAPA